MADGGKIDAGGVEELIEDEVEDEDEDKDEKVGVNVGVEVGVMLLLMDELAEVDMVELNVVCFVKDCGGGA